MPLVEKDGKYFDFGKHKTSKPIKVVEKEIFPNIKWLYDNSDS